MAERTLAAKQMEECLYRLKNHYKQIHSIVGLLKDLNLMLTTMEAKLDQSIMSKSEVQETDGSVKGDANLVTSDSQTFNPFRNIRLDVPHFDAQMMERREKGLCYNCDEKFHKCHICKGKMFALLQVEDSKSDSATDPSFLTLEDQGLDEGLNSVVLPLVCIHW
ncbi:hypothetical protein L6452_43725 [Arctium lappa]|uniref:Uncharacterized protein n=1 Tax=Arctium lappa TaxID=4217 RepID=A0ACB8XD89_ARCLA|nr:hypothetical protein L6452_43725 [Arctium lappa]